MSAPLRWSEIVVNGVRSPVLQAGPEDREEAVVFLHGNPGSSRDWEDLAGRVGEFGRVVAPDMPGFGRADKPPGFPYTVEGYAGHLDAMLGVLGIGRVHFVLHDFGGPWGLAWAAGHRERVASLVLLNIGVMLGYRWHSVAKVWRTPVLGELFQATATRRLFHRSLKRGNPRGLPRPFVDRMYDNYDWGTRRAILKLYRATSHPDQLAEELARALRPLRVPVLVIWGKQDPYVSVEMAERQREVFADAKIVILEESGHWPFADDPESVAAEAVPFLERHYARQEG